VHTGRITTQHQICAAITEAEEIGKHYADA
jgi:hypothetical protein